MRRVIKKMMMSSVEIHPSYYCHLCAVVLIMKIQIQIKNKQDHFDFEFYQIFKVLSFIQIKQQPKSIEKY